MSTSYMSDLPNVIHEMVEGEEIDDGEMSRLAYSPFRYPYPYPYSYRAGADDSFPNISAETNDGETIKYEEWNDVNQKLGMLGLEKLSTKMIEKLQRFEYSEPLYEIFNRLLFSLDNRDSYIQNLISEISHKEEKLKYMERKADATQVSHSGDPSKEKKLLSQINVLKSENSELREDAKTLQNKIEELIKKLPKPDQILEWEENQDKYDELQKTAIKIRKENKDLNLENEELSTRITELEDMLIKVRKSEMETKESLESSIDALKEELEYTTLMSETLQEKIRVIEGQARIGNNSIMEKQVKAFIQDVKKVIFTIKFPEEKLVPLKSESDVTESLIKISEFLVYWREKFNFYRKEVQTNRKTLSSQPKILQDTTNIDGWGQEKYSKKKNYLAWIEEEIKSVVLFIKMNGEFREKNNQDNYGNDEKLEDETIQEKLDKVLTRIHEWSLE